jgi:outer membrane protein
MSRQVIHFLLIGVLACSISGCKTPLESKRSEPLQKTVAQAIAVELESLGAETAEGAAAESRQTTQPQSDVLAALAERREELEAIGPLGTDAAPRLELGADLTGGPQQRIDLSLNDAVAAAVDRNLSIQESRLQPGITAEELRTAEAVFDWVLFGSADLNKIDEPQQVPVINGIPLGTPFNAAESYRFETGLRKQLEPGTELFVSTDLTRFRSTAPGISFFPDPSYTAAARLGVNQPLLRGVGSDVSTASIRIARNQRQRSVEQLRSDLLELAADSERAYWDLLLAWRNLAIAEWLVDVGVQVRETLAGRRELDVTAAEYADAVARVEQRRADVIRARRAVRAASDLLKTLINDPQMTISSEAVLHPIDQTSEAPISYNLREAILSALENRPEIGQAALGIDDATIRQRVASNQRLPLLDLSAQMAYFGLDDDASGAYNQIDDRFIDYIVALTFELPLGNRGADAEYRAARLRRSSAVLAYRRAVQQIIQDVKAALRDVITNYELIEATRSFRVAQAENLRALQVQEETMAGLTPEFLNLKFTRQETLADARRQEVAALVNFDKALAELYRAMGTGLRMKGIDVEVVDGTGLTIDD